jgi:membrane-associated phospholipid phosphatase
MAVNPWPPYVLTPLFLTAALLFVAVFFLLVPPPGQRPTHPVAAARLTLTRIGQDRIFLLFGVLALTAHIVQVNLLNPITREWAKGLFGDEFAAQILYSIEGDLVPSLSALHWWPLLFVVYWVYLVFHNTLVIVAPFFFAYTGERRIARRLLVSYLIIWLLAFPGFTLFPATNPTVFLGLESVLDKVIPGTTELFYRGTTIDNTIPSLHVGLATLIMLHGLHSKNPRLRRILMVYAPLIAFSIVYLQVHWALDILAGALVALIAYLAGCALEKRIAPAGDTYEDVAHKRPRQAAEPDG